ncbi:GAF domain-containing protein [Robiginitalea sp. IMCC44478]|uniref:GAF domain-containing protein n=1 Tax=Robiginitalea sp. IMCC44478 TaxID=3459122 RepID=UPI0040422EA9
MNKELPIKPLISFDKYLRHYDQLLKQGSAFEREKAGKILSAQKPFPFLRDGFADVNLLEEHEDVIQVILQDSFADVLGDNEIKAVSFPYFNEMFNPSRRLRKILQEAGPDFTPELKNQQEGLDYIMACTVILNFHYGYHLDFSRPYFFEIPDAKGVINYYRVLYNADFMEIFPTEKSPEITQDIVDELLARPEDVEFWKSKIPPESFVGKGFVIVNMFNVTADHSISAIKSELIASDKRGSDRFMDELQDIFRSFFRLKDLKVGFIKYNHKDNRFERIYGNGIKSFILHEKDTEFCKEALCNGSYDKLLRQKTYFVVPDVEKFAAMSEGKGFYKGLEEQGIGSAIFAPIASAGELLGILEVVSGEKKVLNGVNATKLDDVMPYIVSAVIRSRIEEENLIDAIIQHECTTVHDAVLWRFKEEAKQFIIDELEGRQPSFKEIVFDEVYPLYGQIDIKGSSTARNAAIQRDLIIQLSRINSIMEKAKASTSLPIYEELSFRLANHIDEIKEILHTNSEQAIFNFIQEEMVPVLAHLKEQNTDLAAEIEAYEVEIDPETQSFYDHRRNYDQSVMRTNKTLAGLLDKRQVDAQEMFPHYFERYKTDGVEHNMYIGHSISSGKKFDMLYLNNLRLWQLQVMVEMENAYYNLKKELPVKLDVASLILVYNTSLSIRFRMDEKRFDVDGTYNARYEVIKKRIDKSYIKGTEQRLTQAGKLVIVYSQKSDELEYLRYVSFLKSKGYFTNNIEIVELEGLQGVSGLKAIRAEILYKSGEDKDRMYTYEDLMETLKN